MAGVRIEDVKAAGVAVDIDRLAALGWESITDEDRYRLKTQGVCAQRQVGVFMIRIRVPGGVATSDQLRVVARLAERYAQPSIHVTTRSGLELHHVRIEDVPAVRDALATVGLTTKGACGDTIRNVIACAHGEPYAGAVLDIAPFVALVHDHIVRISDATNISRKMNVAIACSAACDGHVATSDIGFVATAGADGTAPTFTVWGAGGLGATPRLAIELRRGVAPSDLLAAFDALVAIGVEHGDRSGRAKAKIKMLVDRWGAERMRAVFDEEFERRAGVGHDVPPANASRPADRRVAPALVAMGELASGSAFALADAADRFGDGIVHLTPDQNVALPGIRPADRDDALAALQTIGLATRGLGGITDVVSCVGLEYCPLAITHAMTMGDELSHALRTRRDDPRYADFRIHVSGCPHSCAKHQVADIGLAGATLESEGRRIEAFVCYVGGNARERRLGLPYAKKIPRPAVRPVVEALLATFERHAIAAERFSQTVARIGSDAFFGAIASTLGD